MYRLAIYILMYMVGRYIHSRTDLEDHVEEHVEAGLARIAVSNVGWTQIKQIGSHLGTHCLQ